MRLRPVTLALLAAALPLLLGASALPATGATAEPAGYVVVLEDGVTDVTAAADELLAPLGLAPEHVYEHALRGFAVTAPASVVERLKTSPLVEYVEADRTFTVTQTLPAGIDRVDADTAVGAGSGVTVDVDVAVVDTGVDGDHPDLNVHRQVDCTSTLLGLGLVPLGDDGCEEGTGEDRHGHGTHVAGTIAAIDDDGGVVGSPPAPASGASRSCRDRSAPAPPPTSSPASTT